MKHFAYFSLFLGLILVFLKSLSPISAANDLAHDDAWWQFQAIDTMKYSRDTSRDFLNQPEVARKTIDAQVKAIAETGATHVAIATPYDEEFLPVLKQWVIAARRYHLKVWFRGNWSGWENWFDYPSISREEHLLASVAFVENNQVLFEDGDVFSACPECENGGPGDPRQTGDVTGHRTFLIQEYQALNTVFKGMNLDVRTNFNSMNGDVARLIMDKPTTKALGGLVVIDHYVRTPAELNQDIIDLAEQSGGRVILGEMGAPIPDINGQMTEEQQARWLDETLHLLVENQSLSGLSYWTNMGGSTAIWDDNGQPRAAVAVLKKYYSPRVIKGKVMNTLDEPLSAVEIETADRSLVTGVKGSYTLVYLTPETNITISSPGYERLELTTEALAQEPIVRLKRIHPNFWYRLRQLFHRK